MSLLLMSWLR